MGAFYDECSLRSCCKRIFKRICKCCCKSLKKCPPSSCSKEAPVCEQLRMKISDQVLVLPDGSQFAFNNKLIEFNPQFCEDTFGAGFRHATVEELVEISKRLKVKGHPLCPMIVWATNNGFPSLAMIIPGNENPVTIIPTPSLASLAYSICICK